MKPGIYIVTGLGFGDEGKGSVVDLLCRKTGADLVVRYNGGGQAAHNVVTPEGKHHTFAQVGSGSFLPNVRTLLSRFMMVNPLSYLAEADFFEEKGNPSLRPRVFVDERSVITTPYHIFLNRAREYARGTAKHGTTGMGISETVLDEMARPDDVMRVGDLRREQHDIECALQRTCDALMPEMERLGASADFKRISSNIVTQYYVEFRRRVGILDPDEVTELMSVGLSHKGIIFEGAQGVLLDERYGFHPHTTWSKTTPSNALELIDENGLPDFDVVGVTRTYATRHGAGPFPTESFMLHCPEPYNGDDGMAGQFRQGFLHMGLLKYALRCCKDEPGGAVTKLVVNHADIPIRYYLAEDSRELTRELPRNTREQEALCRRVWRRADMTQYRPTTNEFPQEIAEQLQVPLLAQGNGPSADNKEMMEEKTE